MNRRRFLAVLGLTAAAPRALIFRRARAAALVAGPAAWPVIPVRYWLIDYDGGQDLPGYALGRTITSLVNLPRAVTGRDLIVVRPAKEPPP